MAENALLNLLAPTNGGEAAKNSPDAGKPTKAASDARRAAEEFEAIYLSMMFQSMFTDIGGDGPFSGGPGEKIFRSQLNEELGRILASSGGIGIADAVQREILQLQEV